MITTYGAELELPDVDTTKELPEEIATWNMREDFVMNNIGVAADCKKKFITIGSEINMTPTKSIDQMMSNIGWIYDNFETKTNHFSALHIHVGLSEEVKNDISLLKKLVGYSFQCDEWLAHKLVNPPEPNSEVMKSWVKQLTKWRRKTYSMPYKKRIMAATDVVSMGDAFQPIHGKTGQRLRHLVSRVGVNCRSIYDRGTIEFRLFSGTDDMDQYRAAFEWSEAFVLNALTNQKPIETLFEKEWNLPPIPEFNEELQLAMDHTGLSEQKRTVVKERIIEMYNEGKIPKEALGPLINIDKRKLNDI